MHSSICIVMLCNRDDEVRAKLAVEEELMAVRAEQATREVESAIDKSKVTLCDHFLLYPAYFDTA